MDMFELADNLFGGNRDRTDQGRTITAQGSTASEDGVVGIELDADVTPAEDLGDDYDQTVIDLPTSPDVLEGDEVIVTLVGEGPLKTPIVTANPGSGDRTLAIANNAATAAEAAETMAGEAKEVAEAVGQHVWTDDDGLHVTEITQEEWQTSPSGANQLMNSQGTLIRNGETNQTSSTPSGYAIYDGQGNEASHMVANFGSSSVSLGMNSNASEIDLCGGAFRFSVDTSDPSGAAGTIHLDQDALPVASGIPTLEIITGRATSYAGIQVQGNTADQYPISILSENGREIGFGNLGIRTQGIYFDNYQIPNNPGTITAPNGMTVDLGAGTTWRFVINGAGTAVTAETLAAMLSTSTGTVTRKTGASTWGAATLRRSGKVVTLQISDLRLASALASGSNSPVVASIPSGYFPPTQFRTPLIVAATGNYGNAWVVIGTGGDILISNRSQTQIATTANLSFTATYVIS